MAAGILILVGGTELTAQQTGTVTGQVTGIETGQPLSGAQVFVVDTQIGGLTRDNGRFLLNDVPAGSQQLRVVLVGYQTETQEITVQPGETTVVNFILGSRAIDLDEIVVTGTAGAARRREIGNSISSLGAEEIRMRPVQSVEQALMASSPGVNVLPNSGAPGAGGHVRIRGVNSVTQNNQPLIYVDGVRLNNLEYSAVKGSRFGTSLTAAGSPNQSSSMLNDISPEDIERVEVIKGPAATTLYGTEAAGGVIQIFTKSGSGLQQDTTVWQARVTQGFSVLPNKWGAEEPSDAWFDRYGPESEGLWLSQHRETGYTQEYNLSARGRRGDADYFVSGRWSDESGVLPDQGSEEWGLRANLGFNPFSDLTIRFNNSLTRRNVDWISNGNEAEGFMLNVMRGPRDYTEDLDRRVLQLDFDDQQTRWVSGLDFAYTPTSALDMKLTLGFDYADQENVMNAPFGGWWVPLGERAARRYRVETRTIDFRTTYRAELGGVASSTSTGFEVFDEQFKDVFGLSTTFAGPHDPTLTSGAIRDVVENQFREVNAGFFVQEQLGFADRYFLTAGVRVDGNSAFGDDFGLQAYPKLSASYVISDEAFWPDFFEMTKLRAAYGESGKAPGFFDAEKVWSPVRAKEDEAGVTPENPGNPGLGPERSREIEAGIEASTLEGRVGVDFTYYYQRTSDALIPVTLDPTLGFQGSQLRNVGTLDNWGVEFALDTEPVRTRNISWSLGFILSTNKSEVKDLGGSPPIFRGRSIWVREGYPVASIFAEKVLNPNEIAEPILAEDPDPNFGNNVFLGPVFPETNYSVNTQLRLGDNLRISSRGEFKGGGNQWSAVSNFNTTRTVWPPCFDAQVAIEAGDLSQVTALDRARCRDFRRGTHVYGTDFFRLRELSVSYDVPENWLPRALSSLSLSASGTNLFILTDYGGYDPENRELESPDNELNRHEYYNLPPHPQFLFSVRTSF